MWEVLVVACLTGNAATVIILVVGMVVHRQTPEEHRPAIAIGAVLAGTVVAILTLVVGMVARVVTTGATDPLTLAVTGLLILAAGILATMRR